MRAAPKAPCRPRALEEQCSLRGQNEPRVGIPAPQQIIETKITFLCTIIHRAGRVRAALPGAENWYFSTAFLLLFFCPPPTTPTIVPSHPSHAALFPRTVGSVPNASARGSGLAGAQRCAAMATGAAPQQWHRDPRLTTPPGGLRSRSAPAGMHSSPSVPVGFCSLGVRCSPFAVPIPVPASFCRDLPGPAHLRADGRVQRDGRTDRTAPSERAGVGGDEGGSCPHEVPPPAGKVAQPHRRSGPQRCVRTGRYAGPLRGKRPHRLGAAPRGAPGVPATAAAHRRAHRSGQPPQPARRWHGGSAVNFHSEFVCARLTPTAAAGGAEEAPGDTGRGRNPAFGAGIPARGRDRRRPRVTDGNAATGGGCEGGSAPTWSRSA